MESVKDHRGRKGSLTLSWKRNNFLLPGVHITEFLSRTILGAEH